MLASIQKILSVESIPDADRIEKVKVLGWDCVVKKNQFKEGDLCIYIEIDTIIPKYLLSENTEDTEMIRLKTVKMKGQLSQGLVLPFDYLLSYCAIETDELAGFNYFHEGDDVSNWLGIKKYEKEIPANLQGLVRGNFPGFIEKTDEIKIQSEMELIELLKGKPYYITLKIDGTSGTFYKKDGELHVCSRNLELKEGDNVYWRIAKTYKLDELLLENICIQGEIAGPGIQGNKIGLERIHLFVFNVIDLSTGKRYEAKDLFEYCNNFYLEMVPFVDMGKQFNLSFEKLMELSDELLYANEEKAEGIVVRSQDQTISFKVVSNKFLLKNKE